MEYDFTDGTYRRHKFLAIKSIQIFLFAGVILLTLVITVLCVGFLVRYEVSSDVWNADRVPYWLDELPVEQKFWFDDGIEELREALKTNWDHKRARNVIIFMTHGVSMASQAAVRFHNDREKLKKLAWENFEHFGRILQPCNFSTTCDALTQTTTLFSGIPSKAGLGGLDSTVLAQNCTQAMNELQQVKSIISMAQESNLRTGFVTTQRVSGPTMAALYAHTPNTSWECDANVPPAKLLQGCKDIATQLIDDKIGGRMNVIMGGGRQTLLSSTPISKWDPIDADVCNSEDGRNYLRDWRIIKMLKQQNYALIQNNLELSRLNGSQVEYVMGVFANGNIKPPWKRTSTENHIPELSYMVQKSLEVLKREKDGFLLVVESGNSGIDISEQINELKRLNETINEASKFLSNVLATLPEKQRKVLSTDDLNKQFVADLLEDMNVFAKGPSSKLFKGIYDETYLAQAVSYALKIGQFQAPSSKK